MLKNLFKTIKEGLSKTSNKISDGINHIFVKKKLDKETLEQLEELLLSTDIGIKTTEYIIDDIRKNKFDKEVSENEIREELARIIESIVVKAEKHIVTSDSLQVILVCGVNGNGKTTTIGKLANHYKYEKKLKVAVAACDTFRAAAIEQLEIWANKSDVKLIKGAQNSDPASVAYRSVEESMIDNTDILLIDTAGRLHNKSNLMDELDKINRVIKKISPDAPHQTILVIDATTGQNALLQIENFKKIVDITGIIITKLDGTAKAGIVVAIASKFELPIYAIGIGENINDLRPFNAKEFANNLVGIDKN